LTQLLCFKRLLAEGIHPDLLVIEVVPPFLGGQPLVRYAEMNRLPASRLWLGELALLERYGVSAKKLRSLWWQTWLVPWYERRVAILSHVMPSWLPAPLRMDSIRQIDSSGWMPNPMLPLPHAYLWATEHTRQEYVPYFADYRLGGPSCRALRELLELCRRESITPALLWMPEGTPFRSWYPPAVSGRVQGFLDELSHDFNAPLINAREWSADVEFPDSHHLLASAAAEFTTRLGQDALFLRLVLAEVEKTSSMITSKKVLSE
jgi:hypothetical protein